MDTLSDNAIMLKVKNGDVDKMGLLYERYHRQLFRFLYNMTRQKELSEDLVQNVFIRMLKYNDGFMGFGEFKTWMYRIARNTVYDHFKKVKKTPAHTDAKDYETRIIGEHYTDAQIEKEQELKILEKITLTNISGSVVANTVNGDIVVTFNKLDTNDPMAFSTLNGDVNVTFPADTKANLKLKSDNGEIFSDFEMVIDKTPSKVDKTNASGMYNIKKDDWVYGKINGGGAEMLMKNMEGNIYIKKAVR